MSELAAGRTLRGPITEPLSQRDLELQERLFSFWPGIPPGFKEALVDWMSLNQPLVPISQVQGFERYVANRDTVFPQDPRDGQPFILEVSAGVSWALRYDSSIGDTYKWVFEGGPNLAATVATSETTTSTSYADLATAGPSVTLPKPGVYLAHFGCWLGSSLGNQAFVSPHYGATPLDADAACTHQSSVASAYRTLQFTVTAASQVVKLQYKQQTAGTLTAQNRTLIVTPVRISS